MKTLVVVSIGAGVIATQGAAIAAERPVKTSEEASTEPDPTSKILFLDAEAGVENVVLDTFTADFNAFSVGFLPRSGTGPAAGAAIGLRVVFVTLAVRGRVARFEESSSNRVSNWGMSSIDGEIGFRAPLRRFEPYLTLAAGYTTFGGFGDAVAGLKDGLSVNGFNARLGLGFDYFVSRYVSVGAMGSGEVLALSRPGVPVREVAALPASQTLDTAAVRFLEANGTSVGTALALTGGVKVHF